MKTLYHGTCSVDLASIKKIGLVPGHAKGGDAWAKDHMHQLARNAAKREPSVFVADNEPDAANFARLAAEEMGGDPVIIILHVPDHVFATFHVDELFDSDMTPHAWRAPRVPAACIAAVKPIPKGHSDFEVMSVLSSLMEALRP
ncbi:hypothetical protein [Bradyrhizobium lupini]|uniref:hypothetical protein n=1 Tax=Rhizobium lupini TaxID=136996 RepID=UPI0034C66467